MSEQAALDLEPPEQPTRFELGTYRRGITAAAKRAGTSAARRGDPDGFDLAVRTIRRLVGQGLEVDADAVRREVVIGSNAAGAAFAFLARRGEIRCVGYRVSTSPSRKGGVQRSWRASE